MKFFEHFEEPTKWFQNFFAMVSRANMASSTGKLSWTYLHKTGPLKA